MPTTTLKLGGAAVSMAALNLWPTALTLRLGGVSTLTLIRPGGPLPTVPDPILGQPVELWIDGTIRFAGDVTDAVPQYGTLGWTVSYQCRDLRARGDRIPFTDSNTKGDSAEWNLQSDDPLWLAGRAGRTVGEILTDALTMRENAEALDAKGIGGYLSLSPPTLPAATVADLAALTLIPPTPVSIGGEKLLGSIESFLSAWAPNHALHVRADGVVRFLDQRATTNKTLTLEVDPIHPSPLSRSVADCFGRVVVRGAPIAEPKLLTLGNGGLAEDFAWGTKSNAQAKTDWTVNDFLQDSAARSAGTCVCSDTQTVVLTSNPTGQTWGANEWDQTHRMGVLYVWDDSIPGVDQFVARRVVANAAKSAGGTASFTLDAALPGTSYNRYLLYGVSSGASFVWRKYKIVDPDIAAAVAREFTYPVPFVGANGDIAYMTSYPVGSVCWGVGGPPYSEAPAPFSVDQAAGVLIFAQPTYITAGNQAPADVRALLAVNTGALRVQKPASGFEGTSHAVDGLAETLTVTVPSWRDPINAARVGEFAQDLLDSVKDAVIEGEILYNGLYADALDFGVGLSVAGSAYPTGWEGLNVPVIEVEVRWHGQGSAFHHSTSMRCSNRRSHYTSGAFLRPDRAGAAIGGDGPLPMPPMTAAEPQWTQTTAPEPAGDAFSGSDGFASVGTGFDGLDAAPRRRRRPSARKAAAETAGAETAGLGGLGLGGIAGAAGTIAATAATSPPKAAPSRADRKAEADRLRTLDAAQRGEAWANQADAAPRMSYGPADGGAARDRERAEMEARNRAKNTAREQRRLDEQSRRGD